MRDSASLMKGSTYGPATGKPGNIEGITSETFKDTKRKRIRDSMMKIGIIKQKCMILTIRKGVSKQVDNPRYFF